MNEIQNKSDLLAKLRSYTTVPDDETIQYKNKIYQALLRCPELLYALNNKKLESELFTDDGKINWDEETHEPEGEWDRYFGESANIRPFIFIPETQTNTTNFLCYQVSFDEMPRYNNVQKYTEITFTIYVHNSEKIDELTGIPRHDLIASILRERFNWTNLFGMKARLIYNKESTTDSNYVTRSLIFQLVDTNGIVNTPYGGATTVTNFQIRK